jgi:hypothetical protein
MKGRGMGLFAAGVLIAAGVLLGTGGGELGMVAGDGTWTPEAWVYLPYVRGGVGVRPCDEPPRPSPYPPPVVRVVITEVFYEGVKGPQEPDEYVEFRNEESRGIELAGWTLRDEQAHVFTFPSYAMAPGEVCRVYTNEVHAEWCGFSCGSESAIWDNAGDCARLRNREGRRVDVVCW